MSGNYLEDRLAWELVVAKYRSSWRILEDPAS